MTDLPNSYRGEPVGIVVLIIFLCALPFMVSAWRVEARHGVLVGELSQGTKVVRFFTKITLPLREDDFRLSYSLTRSGKECQLSGELDTKELPPDDDCAGTKGRGRFSCTDGAPIKVRWTMTSCTTGSGKSMGKGNTRFHFAYARNKESAFDELDKVMSSER